jgi:hypothetical protein
VSPPRWLGGQGGSAERLGSGRGSSYSRDVRKALLIGLVVLLILTGIPLFMGGMGAHGCDACGPAHAACTVGCSTLPTVAALLVVLMATTMRPRTGGRRARGFSWSLDPPPRLSF